MQTVARQSRDQRQGEIYQGSSVQGCKERQGRNQEAGRRVRNNQAIEGSIPQCGRRSLWLRKRTGGKACSYIGKPPAFTGGIPEKRSKASMDSIDCGNLASETALFNSHFIDTITLYVVVFPAALVISDVVHVTYMEREIGRWTVKETEKTDRKLK